jgi:hypothetical protein
MVAGGAVVEEVGPGGVGGKAAVEVVELLGEGVGGTEGEGAAVAVLEGDGATVKLTLDFEDEPPLAGGQVLRGVLIAEFIPVRVVGCGCESAGLDEVDETRKVATIFV